MASGIDAEDVAVLCLLEADGDLAISLADLADLIDATERRARASFGPEPGHLRQALAGLVLEACLARPGELSEGSIDDALARVTLRDLLGPMLSRDRLWFTAGGAHWSAASPAPWPPPGARPRARTLLALAVYGYPPPVVMATLERLGVTRAFIRTLLEPDPPSEDDDLRGQVAYQDWFE